MERSRDGGEKQDVRRTNIRRKIEVFWGNIFRIPLKKIYHRILKIQEARASNCNKSTIFWSTFKIVIL